MRQSLDPEIQQYIESLLSEETTAMKASRLAAEKLGLAHISIAPYEAKILQTLVAIHQCRSFVEIGTLTGLSAQYILAGMGQGGQLWSLEKDLKHAHIAREILIPVAQTLKCQIEVIHGDARETLKGLSRPQGFDGIFIDGNKAAYLDYFDWADRNLRPGGLIIADNVFLRGSVWGEESPNFGTKQVDVMKSFNLKIMSHDKYISSIFPTAEGLLVAIKKS